MTKGVPMSHHITRAAARRLARHGAAIAVSALVPLAVHANTVTFDSLPDYATVLGSGGGGSPFVEDGITVNATNGLLAQYFTPGTAHLDDSGTDITSGLIFTMATPFTAAGFTLVSLGYDFFDVPDPLSDNIRVTGLAGGAAVASAGFTLSDVFGQVQSFSLGAAFTALDALLIEIVFPQNSAMCGAPCGHFDLDEVVLNPVPAAVPLPPALALMGAAGLALAGLARRRRRD